MSDSPKLIALRKALGVAADQLPEEGKRQVAEDAIAQILDALKMGVCRLDNWEKRCLAAAITSVRGGRFDQARSLARQTLWPDENRRDSAIARLRLRPGMSSLDELSREFEAARAAWPRSATKQSN